MSNDIRLLTTPLCFFCGEDTSSGLTFNNNRDTPTFSKMPLQKSAHAECYIDFCVSESIKEQLNKNTKK